MWIFLDRRLQQGVALQPSRQVYSETVSHYKKYMHIFNYILWSFYDV